MPEPTVNPEPGDTTEPIQAPATTPEPNEDSSVTADEIAKTLNLPISKIAKVEADEADETDESDPAPNPDNPTPDANAAPQPPTPDANAAPADPAAAAANGATPPAPTAPQPDPAADTTPDFSFQIEDANGATFKLAPGDNLEDALADFEPKSNGQSMAILKQLTDAEAKKAKWESEQQATKESTERKQTIEDIKTGWTSEITELQASKRLPAPTDAAAKARIEQVYTHMAEVNDKRMAAGQPSVMSFEDALDKLEAKEAREAAAAAKVAAKEERKQNAAKVGGGSAPAGSGAPIYRGGAKTADQALRKMGLV